MKQYGIENKINRGRQDFTWFRMSCGHLLLHLIDSKILDSEFRCGWQKDTRDIRQEEPYFPEESFDYWPLIIL